ncbi:unnamed protein product [Dibothriocephalus latus]|uniref:Galactosyltransferase C-terminal domain-containing protein n=1 Tax=Dibothriocephalus latus TaxID=60516 RepID=A0A3P6VEW2_DIBLA|nr:unnamed protein product [Dibothriocephalus latus]
MSSSVIELSEVNAEVLREVALPVWNDTTEKVAIIVPYRGRMKHLFNFLIRMLPFLSKQRKQPVIILTEQEGDGAFNRAKLFNAAIKEIRESVPGDLLHGIDCFILHDVDKVPTSPSILYECGQNVRQLVTVCRSKAHKGRLYEAFLGGVTAFSWEHVKTINGASNLFTGWGGEDDELLVRLKLNNITVDRVKGGEGVFDEFDANHAREKNSARYELIAEENVTARWKEDGLNQTRYELLSRIDYDLFVWLLVSI